MAEETTKISKASPEELDNLFNLAGADNVTVTPEPKINLFSSSKEPVVSLSNKEEEIPEESEKVALNLPSTEESALKLGEVEQDEPQNHTSKDKTKTSILDAFNDLVKDNKLFLFEGEKPLEEYSKKELVELIEANHTRIREEEAEKAPAEFFDMLPSELQIAAKYVADGGKDLKGLFKHLSQSAEIKNIDITTEAGQENAIRQYLTMTDYGSPEEIEAEITSFKDMPGVLEKKAVQFKPKLDAKQQQIIDKEVREQEIRKVQQQEAAVKYKETVIKTLQPGDLGGLKITPSIQGMLFNGLTQANYPSVSGRNTNLFGHLIEKYSYVEPNPTLIAKALWLLNDPKGFEDAIKSVGNQAAVEDTVRRLKTAGQEKVVQLSGEQTNQQNQTVRKTIKKANIFART